MKIKLNRSIDSMFISVILADLPECFRCDSKVLEIMYAYHFDYASPLWSMKEAIAILFRASMEAYQSTGHGLKSIKRKNSFVRHTPNSE